MDTMLWSNGPCADWAREGHVWFHEHPFNVGQHVAHNEMLDHAMPMGYDWHIRIDDDWHTSSRTWLSKLLGMEQRIKKISGMYMPISMNVTGLNSPPPFISAYDFHPHRVETVEILGGIFRMSPMSLIRYFRWDERLPMGMGEARQFANFCKSLGTPLVRHMGLSCSHGGSTTDQEKADPVWAAQHDMLQFLPLGL